MAAGDTYQLAIRGTANGQQIVTVHHFVAEGAGALAQTLVDDWLANLRTAYAAMLSQNYSMAAVACRQINPVGPIGYEAPPPAATNGGRAVGVGYQGACAVIKWTTGFVGKSRRGRTFVGPLSRDDVNAGVILAAEVVIIQAYVTAMMGRYGPTGTMEATAQLAIWSPKIASLFPQDPPPGIGTPTSAVAYVLAGSVNTQSKSQRRRNLGVGS